MHTMMRRISAGNGETLSSTSLVVNNDDLLIKILLCLPVKYLLVLKTVSKQWYSIIFCNSYFMQKHCELHSNKLSLFGLYFLSKEGIVSYSLLGQHIPTYHLMLLDKPNTSSVASFLVQGNARGRGLYIEQSCNGLFLCRLPYDYGSGTRYIYNPSTRRYRMIPTPPPFHNENIESSSWRFYLAFDPQKSLYYEIVFIWRIHDGTLYTPHDMTHYKHQMAVYSSKTGSWRLCGCFELEFRLLTGPCVFWNGCLNWIDGPTLYYFNIAQQVLKSSQRSDELTQKYWTGPYYFEECMGHMYLGLEDRAEMSKSVSIFEMEIDYSGWKQICRVDFGRLVKQYGKGYYNILKVAHVQGEGDEDELKVLIIVPGYRKIVSYDPKIRSSEEVCHFQMDLSRPIKAPAYIESLANV